MPAELSEAGASPAPTLEPVRAGRPVPLLDEIRRFLLDLRQDLPEVFRRRPPPAPVEPVAAEPAAQPDSGARAHGAFSERAAFWSERMGVRYGRITVKDQKTLWGSCTRAGDLNFNWRLTLAPAPVLDYVVIHELCHLLEMNHSRRFWALVSRWCPEYRRHRRWLRANDRALRRP